jgi:hypothetical protein
MKRSVRTVLPVLLALWFGACAVRLGGPSPQEHDALAVTAPATAAAAAVAEQLRAANATVVLLSADQDSAWFAAVAAGSRLTMGRPGLVGGRGVAFLSSLELLGDTTLALQVPGGGSVHMHDALYRIDSYRFLDLMTVRVEAPDLRLAVQTLFGYIATDVMSAAAVLLAVDGPSPVVADSIAVLMRAHYTTAAECRGAELPAGLPIALLYGPAARIDCRSARALDGPATGVHARVVVGR